MSKEPGRAKKGSPKEKPKRILLLTADAGFGHRSAANAVEEALVQLYGNKVEVDIVNPLENELAPAFLRDSQNDYDRWVKEVPELYNLGYNASDALIPTRFLERSLRVLLHDVMKDTIAAYRPQVILSTYPMYQSAVSQLLSKRKCHLPFFTVITDLATVHRLWFHARVDGYLLPNQVVADLASSYLIPIEKITITGIPVHPGISQEKRSKKELRTELGWDPNLTTILAVGSKRVEGLIDALNVANHYGAPLQAAVVAGKDKELYQEILEMDWHIPFHAYEFTQNMPTMMKAADLIICKAGGLIVTESLACGLPMLLVNILPGQESGNAEYACANGAAERVDTPLMMLEALHHLLANDHALLKQRSENAYNLGEPLSALRVAEILWQAAGTVPGPAKRKKTTASSAPVVTQNCD